MLRKLFLDHPNSIGESYGEHLGVAGRFGAEMVAGGAACMIHALVPALFARTGSDTVARLHRQMIAKRAAIRDAGVEMRTVEWII